LKQVLKLLSKNGKETLERVETNLIHSWKRSLDRVETADLLRRSEMGFSR
jgi:hypothetical protein